MDTVHLTQVANDSWNVSWMKQHELSVLRVGCVSNFNKDTPIDESIGGKL